ncbi:MAG: neutral/alkaline non-lysosomal ceramidase N-terminal domain-containing protein [Kiritimatiellia bacterium]
MQTHLMLGYQECIITPGRHLGLAGYASRAQSGFNNSGVLDDLYARALCLKTGDEKLLIVTLDLCNLFTGDADAIRSAVHDKTGVPVSNIMLSVSHTHSGPVTHAAPGNADMRPEDCTAVQTYTKELCDHIVTICAEAATRLRHVRVSATTYRAGLGYNRRLTVKDAEGQAQVKMLFNLWQHPQRQPQGPTDPDMPVLMFETIDEAQADNYLAQNSVNRLILFNCAMHPVVLGKHNRYVSADYVGAARRCLERTLGAGTRSMFLLGACGDTEPALATQYNPQSVEIVGNAIGYGIATVLAMRQPLEVDSVKAIEDRVELKGDTGPAIRIQTLRIGAACIAAVSGEAFTELGIKVRQRSPFQQTLIATNTNGCMSYLPTRDAFALGGYEIERAHKKGYDEALLERIESAIITNLERLRVINQA